jgi:hypothetical protein
VQNIGLISPGQSHYFNFAVTPLAGSSGTFTFTFYGGAGATMTCVFNPPSLAIPAGCVGYVSAKVSTGNGGNTPVGNYSVSFGATSGGVTQGTANDTITVD